MWKCKECEKTPDRLQIHWGQSGLQKVDIIDCFCPFCGSDNLEFIGTKSEEDEYWDMEWERDD